MKNFPLVLLCAVGLTFSATAQTSDSTRQNPKSLLEVFKKGSLNGQFRSFFMATDNAPGLSDYYAWAAGGTLAFQTASCYGFRFGLGGTYHYNLASSDLTATDPKTGARNRYEIGLFDVEDPKNKTNLDRLEEFWLQYQNRGFKASIGKQRIQTPFINHQDGRMRPTAVEGVYAVWGEGERLKIEGGWIWRISPRSTVKYYDIGQSIGLYPKGLNPDGTGSGYAENLPKSGVGLLGITRKIGKHGTVQVWDQYVDRIFNTVFVKAEHRVVLNARQNLRFGLLALHQNALNDGGNSDPAKTYFSKGGRSNAVSAMTTWQIDQWQYTLAYTRVTADGRFLSPREWGREPFYTFMARERIEGSGDSHSAVFRTYWQTKDQRLKAEAAYGMFFLPDVKKPALNKYAFPAFRQFNVDVRYKFKGWMDGLEGQFLYVWKGRTGEVYGLDKYVINKVDMSQYNLVLNYYF